jgi:hypothetical protein
MKKLYVVDLSKNNFDIKIHNSEIIYFNSGNVNIINSKILKINNLVKNKDIKKIFINSLKKKLKLKNDFYLKEFEIYNIRNDKNIFISKILNYIILKNFIKNNHNKYEVHCISDNKSTNDILNQITKKKIKNEYHLLDSDKVSRVSHNLFFFKFILKIFLIVLIMKLFNQKNVLNKLSEEKKKWAVSLFPNFYKNKNEYFFGKEFNKINFLFSDETHLNHSFSKILKIYFKNRNNILNIESFIHFKDILLVINKKLVNNRKYKNYLNGTLKIDELDFTNFYQTSIISSYINRSKLSIYNQALNRFQKFYNIKEFHLYLFEYNFGFYLIRHLKKNKCKITGYQHGVFNKNLLWLDLVTLNKDKAFYPNTIVSNYAESLKYYKLKYKNDVTKYISVKKKISEIAINIKIKKNNQSQIKILLVAGTHDIRDIYNYCKKETIKNKKYRFHIKTHPKNKFLFDDEKYIRKIDNLKKQSFQKVLISSTSTIGYDMKILKKRFITYQPDYKSC